MTKTDSKKKKIRVNLRFRKANPCHTRAIYQNKKDKIRANLHFRKANPCHPRAIYHNLVIIHKTSTAKSSQIFTFIQNLNTSFR